MSFEDWYNPTRNTPEGVNSTRAGAQVGVGLGSMFGPAGAALGAFAGAAVGAFSGNNARRRARRRATNEAYQFAGELFNYSKESQTNIANQYERDLSLMTARFASSGGTATDAFRLQQGKLVQTRDAAMTSVQDEVSAFREGESYEWFVNDYERLTGMHENVSGSLKQGEQETTLSVGYESRSSADHVAFNESQQALLQTYTYGSGTLNGGGRQAELFSEYAKRVAPTIEWYERRTFGDADDLAAYNDYMDQRIADANTWYNARRAIVEAEDLERQRVQDERDDRGK